MPCPFRLHTHIYLPMKMEETECSETSEFKLQTPGNYPEESIQHIEQGESLKCRVLLSIKSIKICISLVT